MTTILDRKKPLGGKAYGSIPHLPGSRMGPADYHCHEGQRVICCEKRRDKHDVVIVTEKLDGSNVSVANIGGKLVPLTRAGYVANTSPYPQHHIFFEWALHHERRFLDILSPGERLVGEWLAQAHGTRYALQGAEPFVPFDLIYPNGRVPTLQFALACAAIEIIPAKVIHVGEPLDVDTAMELLGQGHHGAIDPVEGAVWRVERRGAFDFIAKWVRPDKKDGCLLPDISGTGETVWNWRP